MIKFNRKDLINSQIDKLERIYKDVNYFIWLGWVIATIFASVVMYFFSIMGGLWFEAVVVFSCAIYYLIMSFVRERLYLGYYQNAKEIQIDWLAEGIAIKELTKENEFDYLVAYSQIYKIIEYKKYFVILLKNEGRITLPNIEQAQQLKTELKNNIGNRYFVYES